MSTIDCVYVWSVIVLALTCIVFGFDSMYSGNRHESVEMFAFAALLGYVGNSVVRQGRVKP